MTRKKGMKNPRGSTRNQQPEAKGKPSRLSRTLVGLAVAVALAGTYLVFMRHGPGSQSTDSATTGTDFQVLVGKWLRPDGGYIISVQSVAPDGRVDAAYFNPRPINVSRAEASVEGKAIKLFIELQAAGYPGSTYELIYDPDNDTLIGIYFQAAMGQRFEVVFVRTQ